MIYELVEQHKKEWEQYFDERFAALIVLDGKHWETAQKRRKMNRRTLAEWKALVRQERKDWLYNWALNGFYFTQLRDRQQQELKDVGAVIAWEEVASYLFLPESWTQVDTEQAIIRQFHKKWRLPVPMATMRRMVIQVDLYRMKWNGVTPEIHTDQWHILTEKEIKDEFKSWEDLRQAHSIIMWLYDIVFFQPRSFERRMAFEIEQYWKEVDPTLNDINRK